MKAPMRASPFSSKGSSTGAPKPSDGNGDGDLVIGADPSDVCNDDEGSCGSSSASVSTDYCASDAQEKGAADDAQAKLIKKQQDEIARAESRSVRSLKAVVLVVLVVSAVGVALSVYFYTSSTEQAQFESGYQGDVIKVFEGIGRSIENTLVALDTFQVTIVSEARAAGQKWPFVTVPDFAVRATKTRLQSDGFSISTSPLVTKAQKKEWEEYAKNHSGWINESMKIQENSPYYYGPVWYNHSISDEIFGEVPHETEPELYMPAWQTDPIVTRLPAYNNDLFSMAFTEIVERPFFTHKAIMGPVYGLPNMSNPIEVEGDAWYVNWLQDYVPPDQDPGDPSGEIYYPIFDAVENSLHENETHHENGNGTETQTQVMGLLWLGFFWRDAFTDLLPQGSVGIDLVLSNPCTMSCTYRLDGQRATFVGAGDLHEMQYDKYGVNSTLLGLRKFAVSKSSYTGVPFDEEFCPILLTVYPSSTTQAQYTTTNRIVFTVCSVLIFGFTSVVFVLYDKSVERRQNKVMKTAVRAETIVQSLFPAVVRDRIYPTDADSSGNKAGGFRVANSKSRIQSFLGSDREDTNNDATEVGDMLASPPVADLFPECTVMFTDIVGFTSWSSVREPAQVFTLLETIYGAFDAVARRRGVYKVETIGDSYVAVAGLPVPREDHAVVMARFARDCRDKMSEVTRRLEKTLGPDTSDLKLRFGLNSGPVTAGVLRGERSRFQLFGDTVNCASRMESNGKPGMIQCSQKTADLLIRAGKGSWVAKRDEMVEAKGKGMLQTYWVEPRVRGGSSSQSPSMMSDTDNEDDVQHVMCGPIRRGPDMLMIEKLVEWNMEHFTTLAKRIVARRIAIEGGRNERPTAGFDIKADPAISPRSEVTEIISLPQFDFKLNDPRPRKEKGPPADVVLAPEVVDQLRHFISTVAHMYRDNPFHNFEHATHVTFSLVKLLQRVVTPDVDVSLSTSGRTSDAQVVEALAANMHVSTYGITSDPLTQFAVVFAALVHDVDHPGVGNGQLVAEGDPIAAMYSDGSPAEQNSVSIAWNLLMSSTYRDLRACLFASDDDLKRFRQLVVNAVMATDIFDPDLKAFREARWSKAFAEYAPSGSTGKADGIDRSNADDETNRKATVVIEVMIQCSDVAHTMQHWMVYQKWNKQLFHEMYVAYVNGRHPTNPADGWYKGELWFFDNYVIPLATKLRECRVFGVSCDEFLDYATDNRNEWEAKGQAIVAELVREVEGVGKFDGDLRDVDRPTHAVDVSLVGDGGARRLSV